MRIRLREEDIKFMEQPKYRFADLHLQSDKNYTDINDTIVGFLFDRDIIVPFDIQILLNLYGVIRVRLSSLMILSLCTRIS